MLKGREEPGKKTMPLGTTIINAIKNRTEFITGKPWQRNLSTP